MRALSLWQPWSSAIFAGKRFETRSWATSYRGELAIHAGSLSARELERRVGWEEVSRLQGICAALGLPPLGQLPRGAVLGTVMLEGCGPIRGVWDGGVLDSVVVEVRPSVALPVSEREQSLGDFTPGRYGWWLESPRLLEQPVACRGHQSLFVLPFDVAVAMERQTSSGGMRSGLTVATNTTGKPEPLC